MLGEFHGGTPPKPNACKGGYQEVRGKAVESLFGGFTRSCDKGFLEATDPRDLASAKKHGSLNAISDIEEKRDDSLKGGTCANGEKQKEWKTEAESRSPAVHADSAMLTPLQVRTMREQLAPEVFLESIQARAWMNFF